jgi:hypothetical protein
MEAFSTRRACFFKSTTFCRCSFFMSRINQKAGCRRSDRHRVCLCAGGRRKRARGTVEALVAAFGYIIDFELVCQYSAEAWLSVVAD